MRKYIDKIKPAFEKGGKFGFLHSTFDAFESFLYVPDTVTRKGSHIRDCVDLKRIMIIMVLALVPAMLFGIWNTGYQHSLAFGLTDWGFWDIVGYGLVKVIPLYLVSYIVGLAIEFISAQIRGHEVNEGYLVSGMIIPLIVPADVPLWMLAIAVAFAVMQGSLRRHWNEYMESGPSLPCVPVLLLSEHDVRRYDMDFRSYQIYGRRQGFRMRERSCGLLFRSDTSRPSYC